MSGRHIEHISLEELRADPGNPKGHSIEDITDSVGRLGFIEPVVTDGRTGYLISGHGRVETLTNLRNAGEPAPDGILVDPVTDEWLIPTVTGWESENDDEALAALIALNRTGEKGGWVDPQLLASLDRLAQREDGLLGVGYGEQDIEALRRRLEGLTPDAEVVEVQAQTVVRCGCCGGPVGADGLALDS